MDRLMRKMSKPMIHARSREPSTPASSQAYACGVKETAPFIRLEKVSIPTRKGLTAASIGPSTDTAVTTGSACSPLHYDAMS